MKYALVTLLALLVACGPPEDSEPASKASVPPRNTPLLDAAVPNTPTAAETWRSPPNGFPSLPVPEDNLLTNERIELGRRLFYDKRLSRTEEVACASCHLPEHAFADTRALSLGVRDQHGQRNAPALANVAYLPTLFWDGGVSSLELQAIEPIRNPLEMDMTLGEVCDRLAQDTELSQAFELAYGEGPSEFTLTRALAAFERTLLSGNSAWDRYQSGDTTALTEAQQRGLKLFNGERGECSHCHTGYNFTTNAFRNNGMRPEDPDVGRERLTQKVSDRGKFKVPSLRNVSVTAPYMHDGALTSLEDVIEHYNRGGEGHPNTDPLIFELKLNVEEKADLRAFLDALTDSEFLSNPQFTAPAPLSFDPGSL